MKLYWDYDWYGKDEYYNVLFLKLNHSEYDYELLKFKIR